MAKSSVTIQVPATTSNLGPGFDTLGIALNLYNTVTVTRAGHREINLASVLKEGARAEASKILMDAAALFFRLAKTKPFGVRVKIDGQIPIARGLGSSVGVRLGLVAGLNELSGSKLSRHSLLNLVAELEHHPDNAAPAIFGGFTIAGSFHDGVRCLHYPVPTSARFVTLIPRFEINTEKARALLPKRFAKEDVVHNLSRVALLSASLATRQFHAVDGLFEDRLHQPYRQQLIPALFKVINAGQQAGAIGGWLSGSGSTIICLAFAGSRKVAAAMHRELPDSEVKILQADNHGFRIMNP